MALDSWLQTTQITRGNLLPPLHGLFSNQRQGIFYKLHLTDSMAHTTGFLTPVVKHWQEQEIIKSLHQTANKTSHHMWLIYYWPISCCPVSAKCFKLHCVLWNFRHILIQIFLICWILFLIHSKSQLSLDGPLKEVITLNQIPLTTIVTYLQTSYRSRISNHWATIPACSVVPPIYKQSKKPILSHIILVTYKKFTVATVRFTQNVSCNIYTHSIYQQVANVTV